MIKSAPLLPWMKIALLTLGIGWAQHSAAERAAAKIAISLTVFAPPPCTINNNKTIEVDFGNVGISNINNDHNVRPINFNLACSGLTKNQLRLQITGTESQGFSGYLQTNHDGLAIKLMSNGNLLPINSWLNFNWPDVPELSVAPVSVESAALTGGAFNATATLRILYQ